MAPFESSEETTAAAARRQLSRSRRLFVITGLLLHAILTIWYFPQIGRTGGLSPNSLYTYYFVYTSIPTAFVAPFIPVSARSSNTFVVCLIINSIFVARFSSIGLCHLIYGGNNTSDK
ncbi:MAG: hypothetical protein LW870_07725 [Pirellula sp.]|jgi:hypothetical protein|nr:hypothetical protein [Pirellula sp.]